MNLWIIYCINKKNVKLGRRNEKVDQWFLDIVGMIYSSFLYYT
jgi:hypothetical protein